MSLDHYHILNIFYTAYTVYIGMHIDNFFITLVYTLITIVISVLIKLKQYCLYNIILVKL